MSRQGIAISDISTTGSSTFTDDVLIYGNNSNAKLAIKNNLDVNILTVDTANKQVLFDTGTSSLPSITFYGDSNTGLYRPSADNISIVTGGVPRLTVGSSSITNTLQILSAVGTATNPTYSFTGDTNTGIYSSSSDTIAFSCGGTLRASITSIGLSMFVSLYEGLGSAAAPTYSFSGDTNTGIYSAGADSVNITTGGTLRATVDTTNLTTTLPVVLPAGSASTPAITFSNNTTGGLFASSTAVSFCQGGAERFYFNSTNLRSLLPFVVVQGSAAAPSLRFDNSSLSGFCSATNDVIETVTNNVSRLQVSTTAVTSTLPIVVPAGSTSAPSYTFSGDTDTGLYSSATDTIDLTTAGTTRVTLNTASLTTILPVYAAAGAAATPSFTFSGDSDTGLYNATANEISFACGAGRRMYLNTTALNLNVAITGQNSQQHTLRNDSDSAFADALQIFNATSSTSTTVGTRIAFKTGSTTQGRIGADCSGRLILASTAAAVVPDADNTTTLGSAANRWSTVYAQNATINVSDERQKNNIVTESLGLDFINAITPRVYSMNSDSSGKRHHGMIAQEIKALLLARGMSINDFAGYNEEAYTTEYLVSPPVYDEEGNLVTPAVFEQEQHMSYGLGYTEFIAPLIKAVQELTARVAALES